MKAKGLFAGVSVVSLVLDAKKLCLTKHPIRLGALFATFLNFALAASTHAQTAYTPNVNNVGLPETGVFSGGSIDSVQLQNGNLHVDIPLLHLPGIGMDTDIHFVYDNQLFNSTSITYNTAQLPMYWQQISIGRTGFVQVSDPLQAVLKVGTHEESWQCETGITLQNVGNVNHIDYVAFTDSNGTGHSFPIDGYETAGGQGYWGTCIPANYYPANSYSGDATGFNLSLSTVDGSGATIIDKHGTQYTFGPGGGNGSMGAAYQPLQPNQGEGMAYLYPTALSYQQVTKVEDSNGNVIIRGAQPGSQWATQCQSTYCFTDTVGRTIMETYQNNYEPGIDSSNWNVMSGEASANEPHTIQYLDQNNVTQTITINYSWYTIDLPLVCGGGTPVVCGPQVHTPAIPTAVSLPTSIVLQNGDTYTIQYLSDGNPGCTPQKNTNSEGCTLGEISSITLPTGGVISYTYGAFWVPGRSVLSRTVTANGQSSTWQFNGGTVTDPNMNDTVYTFDWTGGAASANSVCVVPGPNSGVVTKEVSYNGPQSANNPIVTKKIGYSFYGSNGSTGNPGIFLPTSHILTWNANGATTETDTTYDNPVPLGGGGCSWLPNNVTTRGNVTSKIVYDYGSNAHGAMLSNTKYSYLHDQYSSYAAKNIADRVSQVSVYSGSGALVAQTTTNYDGFIQSAQSGLAGTAWSTNHDNSAFSSGQTLRGLPTSSIKCSGSSSSACSASITTYTDYNILGQPTVSTDGLKYSTTNTYSYAATNPPNTDSGTAFLITTTMPSTNGISHVTTQYQDVNTGLSIAKSDQNGNLTEQTYDAMMRPLCTIRPDNGTTCNNYQTSTEIITTVVETPSPNKVTTTNLDGLGRTASVSTVADSTCGSLTVNTTYDLLGRVSSTSNPHCNSSQATDGWTQYAYDAISRLTTKTNPDGSAQNWSFSDNVVNSYDENFNLWTRTYNAVDWLTKVLEPSGATSSATSIATAPQPTLETDYSYDTLGNLLQVSQCGGPCPSSSTHVRTFTYDALSRLLTASNVETGTVNYSYDNNSNVQQRSDNRGIATYYAYDALNRVTSKSYSDSTPAVSFTYDSSSISGHSNDIGQLTQATVQTGSTILATTSSYAYDPMGRLWNEQQCTPANCGSSTYNLFYAYDLGGKPTSATFPSNAPTSSASSGGPVTFSYSYDNAERLLSATSSWFDSTTHPATLFQAPSSSSTPEYGPMGLQNATLGVNSSTNAITGTLLRSYDDRDRVVYEADGAGSDAVPSTDSTGSITISGTEGSPVTKATTPGSATLTVYGSEQTITNCTTTIVNEGGYPVPVQTCNYVPDTGWLTVTVQGFSSSTNYGSGSTCTSLASGLAVNFTQSGSPVSATASGCKLTITAKVSGSGSNYTYTTSSTYSDESFWVTPATGTLTGGFTGGTFYDTGTLTAQVRGLSAQVNWGPGSTPSGLASSLATAFNSQEGVPNSSCPTPSQLLAATGFVTACANGNTITMTSLDGGPAANQPITVGATDTTNSAYYAGTSFGISASPMSGASSTIGNVVYSYLIPNQGGFAPNGNLMSVQDTVTGTWNYSYDNLHRLLTGSASSGYYSGAQMSWSYDPFGNRKSESVGGSPSVSMPSSTAASYTAASNQVSSYSYDAAGDMTYDGLNSYLYDAEGRLCAVKNYVGTVTGYVYDAAGTRVAKGSLGSFACNFAPSNFTLTTSWVLGPGGEQVTEYAVSGTTNTWQHTNAFSGGKLQVTYHDTGTYFYLGDWLGTKRTELGQMLAANGTDQLCAAAFASLPYGDGLTPPQSLSGYATCPDATEHHYTGKERDAESGNDYFGKRYYSSSMGRWMSPDPAGVAFTSLSNPQSWNLYSYVQNNPLNSVDPDGQECVWDDGSFDSATDQQTGNVYGCGAAGGTYYEPSTFTAGNGQDWSSAPNADLAAEVAAGQALAASLPQGPDPSSATGSSTSTNGTTTTIDLFGLNWQSTQVSTGTHPWRDNNPGDIISGRFVNNHGSIGSDGRFGVFPTAGTGSNALDSLLRSPTYSSKSISDAISTYAPAFENNTAGYQQFLTNALGVSGNTPLSSLSSSQMQTLENAISAYEGYNARGNFSVTTTSVITPR